MPQIKIKSSNSNSGVLTLDPEEPRVNHTDHVTWHLETGCGVEYIIYIKAKPSNPNIWSKEPTQDGGSTNWQGTISKDAPPGDWNYNIKWRATDGTLPPVFDPKIIVNSQI
jgi:hypothetical protein